MKKNIIITGASGLIGTSLLKTFENHPDYNITAIYHHNKPSVIAPNIKPLSLNLSQRTAWSAIPADSFFAIIHSAAQIPRSFSGDEAMQAYTTNKNIDTNLINFVDKKPIKLIYLSSVSVYKVSPHTLINEESPTVQEGAYQKGKIKTEAAITKNIPNSFIFRISAPFGPCQRIPTVISIFIKKALAKEPLTYYGTGQRKQDFIYVPHVAQACLLALTNNHPGIYTLASGNSISMKDLSSLIKELTHSNSPIEAAGKEDPQEYFQPQYDISKSKKFLEWEPKYSLKQGLSEYIKFLKESAQ